MFENLTRKIEDAFLNQIFKMHLNVCNMHLKNASSILREDELSQKTFQNNSLT